MPAECDRTRWEGPALGFNVGVTFRVATPADDSLN